MSTPASRLATASASSNRLPSTPSTTLPNICTSRRYESQANRSLSVTLARPWTERSFNPTFRIVSSIPGIESRAPLRTDTSSGSWSSPNLLPAVSSRRDSAVATCSSRPSGSEPERMYATHASVVIVNPAGTRSAPSTRVISATFAPFPPSSSRMSFEPSAKSYTHLCSGIAAARHYRAGRDGGNRAAPDSLKDMPSIGVSTPRRDSEPKVRGTTRYAADVSVNGLLHARLLLAHEAHALIKSIDTTAARELPGVVAVLIADDLPIVATGPGREKEPLAREEIRYAGQPIAIAVAETEALAADAIELIDVELEPVTAVLDVEGAILPSAARARLRAPAQGDGGDLGDAHAAVAAGGVGDEEELSENVLGTARLTDGDVDAAFAASEVVVRGRFHTPWVYQGYIEPQTATAWFDVEDELIVEHLVAGAVHDP